MNEARDASEEPAETAARALASGWADDSLAQHRGRLLESVPIVSPGGTHAGWMVPVEVDGALLGFVQLTADGQVSRYAAYPRRGDSTEGCPRVDEWLNPQWLKAKAQELVGDDDSLSDPILSYDGSPDRLAWMIRAAGADEQEHTVYVAGDFAWLESDKRDDTTA